MSNPSDRRAVYRVLDANLNRSAEGLRVVEDYVRFVLQDELLQQQYKALRHALREASRALPEEALARSRDAAADIGAEVETPAEYVRQDAEEVVQANVKRVEQSLRALEEFSKTISTEAARQFERCRYTAYELARRLQLALRGRTVIPDRALYVLIGAESTTDDCLRLAESLIEAGVALLQLRNKQLSDRQLIERGRALAKLCRGSATRFIFNDRPDLARLSGADGVHVGQDELSVSDVRELVGPRTLIGVSTHDPAQFEAAQQAGADYVGCGPTFPSRTKQFDAFPGLEFLNEVQGRSALPAFAIGGITLENLSQVLATGFRRVAVGQAVTATARPAEAARQFLDRLAQ